MSSDKKEVSLSEPIKSEFLVVSPTENEAAVASKKIFKLRKRVEVFMAGGILGIALSWVPSIVSLITISDSLFNTIFFVASLSVPVSSIFGLFHASRLRKLYTTLEEIESDRVKQLLYKNFGRSGGITPEIVARTVLNGHKWVHNNERFIVTFDDDTNTYSFDREDYFAGMVTGEPELSFQTELKPLFLKLKAAEFGSESSALVKGLLGSVSQLIQTPLQIEAQHEVKRILVDAEKLVDLSSELAVFDVEAAESKLSVGLQPLVSETEGLVAHERQSVERRLDSYTSYVQERSLTP